MRLLVIPSTFLLVLAAPISAAPALGDKPPKWEYAELTVRLTPLKEGPDAPTEPPTIRWTSGTMELAGAGWSDMATKLKAPAIKKEASATSQKIQFLNYLGSEGWELLFHQGGTEPGDQLFGRVPVTSSVLGTWLFKRRVP